MDISLDGYFCAIILFLLSNKYCTLNSKYNLQCALCCRNLIIQLSMVLCHNIILLKKALLLHIVHIMQ